MSARALPLITQDEATGKYEVAPEALELLATIEAPVAIVAIAGLWRTGKSYLLNHFSGAVAEKKGFAVGGTVNACTKGLWLWGQPVKLPDGLNVLFVDTEGLGSTSRTQTEDSQIFSLALLLSSLFVWNSRGVIDGNALEDFALVVNLTKHIHVRSNAANKALAQGDPAEETLAEKEEGEEKNKKNKKKKPAFVATTAAVSGTNAGGATHELESLAEHFPSFLWVVRDFTLRLEDQGRKINDRQYLENALKPQQSFTSEAASRNQIRTLLSSFFRERDCVTLVRPAEDEAVLRDLSNVPLEQLRPEFQKALDRLKGKVFASVRPKAVKGRCLSGSMLGTLACTYAEALNSGTVPTISTAWDRVLQSQAAEAAAKALGLYDAEAAKALAFDLEDPILKGLLDGKAAPRVVDDDDGAGAAKLEKLRTASNFPLEMADLAAVHERAASAAEAVYLKAVWADDSQQVDSSSRALSSTLDKSLAAREGRLAEVNRAVSTLECARLMGDLIGQFQRKLLAADEPLAAEKYLDEGLAWLERYVGGFEALMADYDGFARGPAKWGQVLAHADDLLALAQGWATRLGVAHRKMQKIDRSKLASKDEAFQSVSGKVSASRSAASRELAALERAAVDAEREAANDARNLETQVEARIAEIDRLKQAQERLQRCFDYAQDLVDKQSKAHTDLADDLKQALRANAGKAAAAATTAQDSEASVDTDGGAPNAKWELGDLGLEGEEMAEFAGLGGVELKERVADDEKELELMHEHAALTIEHAKVKKMLLADKDHELQEYEYQWGVAKANLAASEGELMVVEEEVSVLRGLVLQLTRYHTQTTRSSKLPADLLKSLTKDQKAALDALQDEANFTNGYGAATVNAAGNSAPGQD